VAEYAYRELRYRILAQTRADEARVLMRQAQAAVDGVSLRNYILDSLALQ
jgi:hypothetical protein